jgi:hypothetical protein
MRNSCIALALLACGSALAQRAATPPAVARPLPPQVTLPITSQGVPPTPAPAFPGLPTAPVSPSTPSTIGPNRQTQSFSRGAEVNDPTQVAATQRDLASLGIYQGPIDGQLDATTRAAVRQFQLTQRLPATGQLDADTAAAVAATVIAIPATTPSMASTTTMSTTTTTAPATASAALPPTAIGARIGPPTSLPPTRANVVEQFPLSIGSLNPEPIFIQP